ncbi:cellulose-binding protein [Streptomyces phaeoluteigriseus]|uniref:Cellulose-binding protein n=1 Tax=Streptomyces phaeoluteigriseus TaxID=114686 RepID=A0ABY4ZIM3_9ACTN|nr:cellulose-binding protein [Streptomyces phaeoluteigriseus]USQ88757.1 cellulose-binding protein [Streptomyces phaeoluteigriseus]
MAPPGFTTVRGRGYRPAQVDAYTAALSADRDAAWERAARLTVLAKDMEAEAVRLREAVSRLAPQTYDGLGERARRIFQLGQEEAAAVREDARRAAREQVAQAEADAAGVRAAARERADEVRAEAEERARHKLLAARAEADEIRVGARREVKENRGEALAALREMRRRTAAMLADRERDQAERWAAAVREEAERAAALDAHHTRQVAHAEAVLSEAKQALADAEESARRCQEAARARAAELLTEARARAELIARETERVLREHGERWDDVQAHIDHVRGSLSALTGRAVE